LRCSWKEREIERKREGERNRERSLGHETCDQWSVSILLLQTCSCCKLVTCNVLLVCYCSFLEVNKTVIKVFSSRDRTQMQIFLFLQRKYHRQDIKQMLEWLPFIDLIHPSFSEVTIGVDLLMLLPWRRSHPWSLLIQRNVDMTDSCDYHDSNLFLPQESFNRFIRWASCDRIFFISL